MGRWNRRMAAVLAAAALLTACGDADDDPLATPATPTGSPDQEVSPSDVQPPPITDAEGLRDRLLAIAQEVPAATFTEFNPYDAWQAEFPDLEWVGREEPATEEGVSTLGTFFAMNDKEVVSGENPLVLTIAVADTAGRCAGAYMASTATGEPPTIFEPVDMTDAEACTAAEAFPPPEAFS